MMLWIAPATGIATHKNSGMVAEHGMSIHVQAAVRITAWLRPNTGWPEAVTRLRLPQNVACGFLALRSSERDSQHSECLKLPVWQGQAWSL
jgi:hypothetical protein